MIKLLRFLTLISLTAVSICEGQTMDSNVQPAQDVALKTVPAVSLARYVGTWFEIARIPNRFQKQCACNVTATYAIRQDGRIDVVNRCALSDGSMDEAKGIARIVDTSSNARLEVSFVRILGLQLFWGDYWIIGLDENYQYAVVGSPSRKYGWILSRSPKLSAPDQQKIFDLLRNQGYTPEEFVFTEQK